METTGIIGIYIGITWGLYKDYKGTLNTVLSHSKGEYLGLGGLFAILQHHVLQRGATAVGIHASNDAQMQDAGGWRNIRRGPTQELGWNPSPLPLARVHAGRGPEISHGIVSL